jgi:hypothetical protein
LGNTASGEGATVGGGGYNTASGDYAAVPGGYRAKASHYGELAHASGSFGQDGDAQGSLYVMRATTTSGAGVWNDLHLNGLDGLLTIAEGRTLTFDILVVARSDAAGGDQSAGYYVWGVAERVGGITTVWSSTTSLYEDDSAWDVQASGMFGNHLAVRVSGNGETIRWVATVRTAEVSW